MEKQDFLQALVSLTNQKFGRCPSTPSEFDELSLNIQKTTGRSISLSSLKRIWGYVKYESFPSTTTLNILAQYNGFKSWETFTMSYTGGEFDDSGFLEETAVNIERLTRGERLLLEWGKGKSCEIEYIAHLRFRVNKSKNIKLLCGDTFTLSMLCLHSPLYINNIDRAGTTIAAYIGARKGGITSITRIPS